MKKKRMVKRFWQNSKSSIIILVSAAILVEVIAQADYWYTRKLVKESVEQRAISDLRVKEMEIFLSMKSLQTMVSDYAIDLWKTYSPPNNPDSLYYLLGQMVHNYAKVSGAYCMFKPYYFPDKGRWFEPYAVNDFAVDDPSYYKLGTITEDYTQYENYIIPMRSDSAYWCEPYFDNEARHQMVTGCSVPIRDNMGSKVGVMGFEITLADLAEKLSDEYIYPSSFFVLLSSQGKYLAGKDSLDAEVIDDIRNKSNGVNWYTNADGEDKVVFFSQQEGSMGWKLAIVCSEDEIYKELHQVDLVLIVIGVVGFLLLAFIIVNTIHNLKRLIEAHGEQERIRNELTLANKIQNSMIYRNFPERQDMDLYGDLLPAKAVGGDLYEFLIRDEKLYFCIGDVSGKGIPAALFMTATCSLFQTMVVHHSSPELIVSDINTSLLKLSNSSQYVTLFVGVLDLPTGRLLYCNAGHNPPVLNGELLPVEPNFPVGLMDDQKFVLQETVLTPGSTLFLYTDGITEARNQKLQFYGEERMIETIRQIPGADAKTIVEHMIADVEQFVDGYEQSDDLTMLALRYTQQQEVLQSEHPEQELPLSEHPQLMNRSITLKNQMSELPRMKTFVIEALQAAGIDEKEVKNIRLVIEEAVVNVIQYAYEADQEGTVGLQLSATEQMLQLVITDHGKPFDPTKRPEVDINAPVEERQVGGLGIFFMHQLMDSIDYQRIDDQNVLTLRKNIQK